MHKIIDTHAHLGYWPTLAKAKEMLIYSTNKNKVKLLIVAEDASERTKDKFIKLAKERNVPIIVGGNIEMLSKAIGKNNKAIIGIENVNLSNEIQKINNGGGTIG